ncbi:hypothetical protein FSP39_002241 [Pinctada imbricata]|uniref:Arrestin C-terminal-like domain-containing protein n=1 Tax=Pinctada imbricata TaxID=66713 RepID=A0AA88YCG7_PINIB|nr:hypothetical protein FSP39_002241 [Pinctada imbricata]
MNLIGHNRKHGDCEDVTLHAGDHYYPFEFVLPPTLPSSFEVNHGSVRYFVKIKIDRPSWHKDYKLTTPFTVLSHLDLNFEENAMQPNQMNESKMICCLCCATGPVTAQFRIERRGYVPGEGVRIFAEIRNDSDRPILKSKVKLYQKTTLISSGGHKNRRTTDLAKIERGRIEGGGSDQWTGETLVIPPCPPSFLRGCSIIDIDHWLTFTADIEDTPFDLDLELPVIIGTIPLRNLYTVPQYGGFAPPIGFQGLYDVKFR